MSEEKLLSFQFQRSTLIMMVGLPRSGKTTIASRIRDALGCPIGCPIVCPDQIRIAIHGQRFVEHLEPIVWFTAKTMVKSLFLSGHRCVVLDACNVSVSRRSEWKSNDWDRLFFEVPTSKEECEARASALGDTEIIPVIHRMAAAFEPPTDEEVACQMIVRADRGGIEG